MELNNKTHHYKLIYFDIRGRAEPARAMFIMSQTDFKDERIKFQDWSTRKLGKLCKLVQTYFKDTN